MIRKMLGLFGTIVVVAVIGAAICYKFVETPTIPQKKKARVPDFDVGLNPVRPAIIPV
jgi:peptidoglycan/LPS O-acetylase OafA/YrhL